MAPASTPDKYPPPEAFYHSIRVTVGTGTDEKTFDLHKGVLEFYSGYFEGALRGGFAEALSGNIKLAEENVTSFSLFVHWLYTRKIHVPEEPSHKSQVLCDLWLFADRRQVPLLMNACIDVMRDAIVKTWQVPTCQLIKIFEIMKLVWNYDGRKKKTRKDMQGLDLCQYHWHEERETCKGKST